MLPKISIVVPSYNAAATMGRTLDSILSQGYPDLELICIDGNSSDGTVGVIQQYSEHIHYSISEPDRCQADALNKGFAQASGAILGWLCADDEFAPGALLEVGEFFEKNEQFSVLTGGCSRQFENGESYETQPTPDFYEKLFLKNTIEQPSTFWRADVARAIGPLTEELKFAFDWEYWCRMKRHGYPMQATDRTFSVYHFSSSNLTSTGGRKIVDEMFKIVKEYGPYRGNLARVYAVLYRVFDLRGYYDSDETKRGVGRYFFHAALRVLYVLFDRDSINTYNWNFASRQERGKGW